MIGNLPEVLHIGDAEYHIRTDYRNILQVFEVFADPDLEKWEKWAVTIYLLFECFHSIDEVLEAIQSGFDVEEAGREISSFISAGASEDRPDVMPVYDWKHDEQMIFSAVNKVAGMEIREIPYMHWWTFMGYFNEIGEGVFTFIVGIRSKLNKGKKLEKNEREFLVHNRDIVRIEKPKTKEELREEENLKSLIDDVIG